jgi:hypothetical protein
MDAKGVRNEPYYSNISIRSLPIKGFVSLAVENQEEISNDQWK